MKKQTKQLLNKISVICLALALIVAGVLLVSPMDGTAAWDGSVATTFASGSGTASSPYIINTEAQLGYFLSQLSSNVTYEGKYIRLGKSLDMTGGTWTAAGTFEGTFDGYGYTVTTPFALFDTIGTNGTVKRLCVICTETLNRSPLVKRNTGLIESCVVVATLSGGSHGTVSDQNSGGTIRNCGAIGSVSGSYVSLVGEYGGTIEHCYAALTVDGESGGEYEVGNKGPFCGYSPSTITDCYYNKDLFTKSVAQGTGFTTADMTSASFADVMNSGGAAGCYWEQSLTSGPFGGYPVPTPCYEATTSLAYTSENLATYHTSTLSTTLTATGTGTIYYTLDGTDPTVSSTRKVYGSSITLSGKVVTVRSTVYYNGQYGAVTTQTLIQLLGAGTESDPYRIYEKAQLDAIRLDLTAQYALMNDLTFTDADYASTGVAPGGWKPIGSYSEPFSGSFNGNAYAITGLRGNYGGMFGGNSGTIHNLQLLDHKLFGSSTCGAIANYNLGSGSVLRCYTRSAFTALPQGSVDTIGGVVGSNSGTLRYCWNDGPVYATNTTRYHWLDVGGIVGSGSAEFCYNTGPIIVITNTTTEYVFAGGITATGDAYNCRNDGSFYFDTMLDYDHYVGGISGHFSSGSAYRCVSTPMNCTVVGGDRTYRYTFAVSGRDCYQLAATPSLSQEDYPELDFETEWMMTENGPIPQGLMDADGRCLSVSTYTAPTCEKTGTIIYRDAYTSYTKSWTVPATGHNYGDWTPLDGTDLHIHTCSSEGCGKYETGAHTWEVSETADATCTEDGYTVYECICTASKTVTDEGSATGHSHTEYVSNGDATCTEDGTMTALCDNGCGTEDTKVDEGSKLGHSYTNYVSNGDATCTTDGTKTAQCDNGCGTEDTKTDEGSKLSHSYTEYTPNGDATCTEDGTKTALCDYGCGARETLPDPGSATGHSHGNWTVTVPADYFNEGTESRTCICGDTETRPIPATGPAAAAAANVSYDSQQSKLTVSNMPKDVTVVIAVYDSTDRMVFVHTADSTDAALNLSLAGVDAARIQVFFVSGWIPIGAHHTVSAK